MSTTDEQIIRHFNNHIVALYFCLQKDAEIKERITTAFVLSVFDRWFLITAGHCLKYIDDALEAGYQLVECNLIDFLGDNASHKNSIPFTSAYKDKDNHAVIYDDVSGEDYGFIIITEYYKQHLLKNNVVALNEEVWDKRPPKVDFYKMLGIPEELVVADLENINIGSLFINVERLSEKPSEFPETDTEMFYGQLNLEEMIESIVGMSGGPIFSFYEDDQGKTWYFLEALQSKWLDQSHRIKACPTWVLGNSIRGYLLQLIEVNESEQS